MGINRFEKERGEWRIQRETLERSISDKEKYISDMHLDMYHQKAQLDTETRYLEKECNRHREYIKNVKHSSNHEARHSSHKDLHHGKMKRKHSGGSVKEIRPELLTLGGIENKSESITGRI